jgi:hypothetical protein
MEYSVLRICIQSNLTSANRTSPILGSVHRSHFLNTEFLKSNLLLRTMKHGQPSVVHVVLCVLFVHRIVASNVERDERTQQTRQHGQQTLLAHSGNGELYDLR